MSFDKYDISGAYHWRETDPASKDFNPPLVARYELLLQQVGSDEGLLLDVGSGDGYLSARLAQQCKSVLALEYEAEGAKLASKMLKDRSNVQVVRGNSFNLPFCDASIDCVTMADVIEHLDQAESACEEVARVLKPGGRFILTTPLWRPDRMWDKYHVKEYKPEEMKTLLSARFNVTSMQYFWPLKWSNRYSTRLGWRALKWLGRRGFNPFMTSSHTPDGFGQMLVVSEPKS